MPIPRALDPGRRLGQQIADRIGIAPRTVTRSRVRSRADHVTGDAKES
ncbi:hypothetical protein [Amycolatopsis thermophila]|uniref:Uncharacterized protein n=1 Tax=Amycolatopsis thermophila TaxID=206084 RepID=A0ABU0ETF3_9PSEU|nr:hypothetical protein [Amycolatopsis thermophila]MDQ0378581.1 hypothetical protein [Amycolatopsis thermophila]